MQICSSNFSQRSWTRSARLGNGWPSGSASLTAVSQRGKAYSVQYVSRLTGSNPVPAGKAVRGLGGCLDDDDDGRRQQRENLQPDDHAGDDERARRLPVNRVLLVHARTLSTARAGKRTDA